MGDIIHTLPAITDAQRQIPGIQFDWVVEEAFQEIPGWHQAVRRTIPVAIRRWRKNWFKTIRSGEWADFKKQLQAEEYDYIIDAQGLLKSALLAYLSRTNQHGKSYGLDKNSARESLASLFYDKNISIPKGIHAVDRVRLLFARILHYEIDNLSLNYGIRSEFKAESNKPGSLLFFHSTTWPSKHWPERYWQDLIALATTAGYQVELAWGNEEEFQRSKRLQEHAINVSSSTNHAKQEGANQEGANQDSESKDNKDNEISKNINPVIVLDKLSLSEMAKKLRSTRAVVAVDTGLAHLAAAMQVPSITLFGPTNPGLTAPKGKHQLHMAVQSECSPCMNRRCPEYRQMPVQPPCYNSIDPDKVWQKLQKLMRGEI